MAIPISVPRLGWNMEHGVFVGWLKADATPVRAGEVLFTLEGEKATEDVEGFDGGILHIPANSPQKGDTVAVGAVIGYLLQPGESPPAPEGPSAVSSPPAVSEPQAIVASPMSAATVPKLDRPAVSPRARRTAAETGIDLRRVQGTGRTGRIRERDVLNAAKSSSAAAAPVAVSSIRRVIAQRMLASHLATAPVTLTTTIDATNLVNLRDQFKSAPVSTVPSYTDLLIKLTALALHKHPLLNSRWENEQIVTPTSVHIGIAVDTDAGLLVPVVRDVASLDIPSLSRVSRDLIDRARQRQLTSDELRGGTFTITSLGSFGIDAFTPIINSPECAILGVGRIQKRPAVVDDRVVVRDQLTLSLTFDHRIVDGAPAAKFLQTLTSLIENPVPALLS
jgi:pyruvate dehydrogenase E2 component (dihydrolipoamide acetyltransferase)